METSTLFQVLSLIGAAGTGYFCLSARGAHALSFVDSFMRLPSSERRKSLSRRVFLHGVHVLYPASLRLLRIALVESLVRDGAAFLREKGLKEVRPQALLSSLLAFLGVFALLASFLLGSIPSGLVVTASLAALGVFFVRGRADKRNEEARLGVPDSIQAMKSCFQAGLSLEQTMEYLAKRSPDPLKGAFERAFQSIRLGCSAQEALASLRDEVNAPEFAFVMAALEIQHRSGGSLANVLEDAEDAARGQFELERSLRVQTAQARLSARVVSIMPLVLVGVFSLVAEGFLEPFFSSFAGFMLLLLAVCMQIAGVFMVRKALKIKGMSL